MSRTSWSHPWSRGVEAIRDGFRAESLRIQTPNIHSILHAKCIVSTVSRVRASLVRLCADAGDNAASSVRLQSCLLVSVYHNPCTGAAGSGPPGLSSCLPGLLPCLPGLSWRRLPGASPGARAGGRVWPDACLSVRLPACLPVQVCLSIYSREIRLAKDQR